MRMLYQAMHTLAELWIDVGLKASADVLIDKCPALARVIATQAADRRDGDPEPGSIRVIGDDAVQAQSACSWFPAFACGVRRQPGVQFPVKPAIGTDPQAGGIDPCIDHIGFRRAPRLNRPDGIKLLSTLGWKL